MMPSLFAFFCVFAFVASSAAGQFIVDGDGNNVINGGTYYILPAIWAEGGGLELEKTGNETCPLSVVESPFEIEWGLPWRITSPLRIRDIPTNTSLDFFSVEAEVPSCVPTPSKWRVVEEEDGIKSVKIGGDENTLKGVFKVEEDSSDEYKIMFCPIHGDSCGAIGTSRRKRLVVTDNNAPLVVWFKKVESSEA